MKRYYLIILFIAIIGCNIKEKDNSVVLARVNNHTLTVNELERLLPAKNRTDEQLRSFIKSWVNNTLLFDAALQKGFGKDQKLIDAKNLYFKQIISGAFLESIIMRSTPISNNEIRQRYEQNKPSYRRKEKQASVLIFSTDSFKEAANIKKQLQQKKSGAKKQELIQTNGVQSQLVTKGYLIKELDNAIFSTKSKTIIGPIKALQKYHTVQVLNRYSAGSYLGIEDVYDEIYQQLLKEKQIELSSAIIDSLTTKSTVFINSNYQ